MKSDTGGDGHNHISRGLALALIISQERTTDLNVIRQPHGPSTDLQNPGPVLSRLV